MNIADQAKALSGKIIQYRRLVHQNPELGFEEIETQKFICSHLDKLGIEHKTMAKTGVLATIHGTGKGKRILIRADIDALPMQEENDVEYRSVNPGKMHACGHDAHIAGLLGVAELVLTNKEYFKGTIDLVFQPAEEGPGGASPMIEEGAIGDPENPRIDAAIALHVENREKGGMIGIKDGPLTGSADEIYITFRGKGGHASAPHETIDPVYIAAQAYVSIQGWLSRVIDPVEPIVFTAGKFIGGDRNNIIPDTCRMECTLRTLNEEVRDKIKSDLPRFVDTIAMAYGGSAEVEIIHGYAVGVNNKIINDHIRKVYAEMFDAADIREEEKPILGAEDFFEFSLKGKVPVSMFWMDTYNEEKGIIHPNHSSKFDVDDEKLYIGAATLAAAAISFLNED
ncbi:MAG: amidohydrolase [Candidatus Heimdallarchaeota archaeon]|nr:amidohydrolase [Candidatus Heimdallarchaeota archaeon]